MAQHLKGTLYSHFSHLSGLGYDTRELVFARPSSEAELRLAEKELGISLPPSYRNVLASVSGQVEFRWFAPKNMRFPKPFASNLSGGIHWSLGLTCQFNRDKQDWIDNVFKDPEDEYNRVWHKKLAFYEVGNGDYLAMDLAGDRYGEIIYLSHDDGEGHGYVLADSFEDLLERWGTPRMCRRRRLAMAAICVGQGVQN